MKKWILATLLLAGCIGTENRPAAVPRPRAYPRQEIYPATYSPSQVGNLTLMTNDSAHIKTDGLWADINYPAYGVTVNCTVTPVTATTVATVLDNRAERMALNSGGAYGEITRLTTESGASATLLSTPARGLTPLQFIATDSVSYVLSGAATLQGAASPDSIRPIIEAISADLLYLLQKL